MKKPPTVFVDIDGVVLYHGGPPSKQWYEWTQAESTAIDLLDKLEAAGVRIVLCTARPEHMRDDLVQQLTEYGVPYHQLVMGLTSGKRVVINDAKPSGDEAADAIVVPRNSPIDVESVLRTILS